MPQPLQEFVDSRGVALRVDREAGVLKGVKLIGLTSKNGRRYRNAALAAAAPLYEAAKVNVNHPQRGPAAPRNYEERLGVIREVVHRAGEGLFGDLHFNPKHALAQQLIWDAEHNPGNVGLSHNVLARTSLDGETTIVEEITAVNSVDLVADPATTKGLFEQTDDATSDDGHWHQQLTLESLQQLRPDLCSAVAEAAQAELQREVDLLRTRADRRGREDRIAALLAEHGVGVAATDSVRAKVGAAFYESLLGVDDPQRLAELIAERAELLQRAVAPPHIQAGLPRSTAQQASPAAHCPAGCGRDLAKLLRAA